MKEDNFYLDYNATSPLSKSVQDYLSKGDLLFANSASLHSPGKESKKVINFTKKLLKQTFGLEEHEIIFHSGATEWMNTVFNLNSDDLFIYFRSDHSCASEIANHLKLKGTCVLELKVNAQGSFDVNEVIEKINKFSVPGKKWMNFTLVHSEVGFIWSLEDAALIKEKTNCLIHVDAVQSVGKYEGWSELNSSLDCYTYSSHKFGALKSVGFSFIKSTKNIKPLLIGGGQQKGLRSGTENPLGIKSTELAIVDSLKYSLEDALDFRSRLENIIKQNSKIKIILENQKRACNLVSFVHKDKRNDELQMIFDMNGLSVSTGTACSSGSLVESIALIDLGLKDQAANFIRISFDLSMNFDKEKLLGKIEKVIKSI